MGTTPKTRTITLTDRPPVRIHDDDWPVIAYGTADDDDSSQPGNPPNHKWTRAIRVRRHEDGRTIVYGIYAYSTLFQDEDDASARHGMLLFREATTQHIVAGIHEVADALASAEEEAGGEYSAPVRWQTAVRDCIASLPAETL